MKAPPKCYLCNEPMKCVDRRTVRDGAIGVDDTFRVAVFLCRNPKCDNRDPEEHPIGEA